MSLKIILNLPDTASSFLSGYGAGAKVHLDSSGAADGTYANVSSQVLVPGTELYEFWDPAGTMSTWYKSRIGAYDGSAYSDYSDPFRATSLTAYATLADLRETTRGIPGSDATHDNVLSDLLSDVAADIDALTSRRFYRVPQVSGELTFFYDVGTCHRSLRIAAGGYDTDGLALDLVSVTSLWVRDSETSAYVELVRDTDFYLQPGDGPGIAGTDWPWGDIVLSSAGQRTTFPAGFRAVKVVGVRGFPYVPAPVKRANIDEARERWRQSIGGGPAQAGVNQFGTPIFLTGDSPAMRRLSHPPFARRAYVA